MEDPEMSVSVHFNRYYQISRNPIFPVDFHPRGAILFLNVLFPQLLYGFPGIQEWDFHLCISRHRPKRSFTVREHCFKGLGIVQHSLTRLAISRVRNTMGVELKSPGVFARPPGSLIFQLSKIHLLNAGAGPGPSWPDPGPDSE